jgi:hypothetical protein
MTVIFEFGVQHAPRAVGFALPRFPPTRKRVPAPPPS